MKSDLVEERQAPQFIQKLLKLMHEFPETINYGENGRELIIQHKEYFINQVLPKNFRHGNWRSFIRQLNMYNFRKINRGNDKEIFVNPIFYNGNETNFHQIKRKMNIRGEEEQYEKGLEGKVEVILDRKFGRQSSLCWFMGDVFSFKGDTDHTISSIKKRIQGLGSKKKTKDTKPMIQDIKESFQMIQEASQKFTHCLQIFSKAIQNKSHEDFSKNFSLNCITQDPLKPLYKQIPEVEKKLNTENDKEKDKKMLVVSKQSSFTSVANLIN